jgi:hypothetical protein
MLLGTANIFRWPVMIRLTYIRFQDFRTVNPHDLDRRWLR